MKPLVVDGSTALGFVLKDEHTAETERILSEVEKQSHLYVPAHWWIEVTNGLLTAERRNRIDAAGVAEAFEFIRGLRVSVDELTDAQCSGATFELARSHELTIYDAAYLELAMRRGASLATMDKALVRSAKLVGVTLLV